MNQPMLPDYLRNRTGPKLVDHALDGLGISQPPHISIRGNRFTLIDQAGNEQQVQTVYLDVCIADLSGLCKKWFEHEWEPGSTDPPSCFSADGIVPSPTALNPPTLPSGIRVRTCGECPKNVIGSAVSKLSGVGIKACRDEKWLALMLPGQNMIFQLVLTPGSFKNWTGYVERFKGQEFDLSDVVTRLNFEAGKNGVLTFEPSTFIDPATADLRNKAKASKATDIYVGRTQPSIAFASQQSAMIRSEVEGGLAIPPATGPFAQPSAPQQFATPQPGTQPQPGFSLPAASLEAAQNADFANPHPGTGTPSTDGRRKRRTKAEMEAARAGQAVPQQSAQQAVPAQPQGFQPAPFRPAAPPEQAPNGPVTQFGMSSGVTPNPELAATLNSIMGKA